MGSSDRPLVGTRGPVPRRDGERRRTNGLEGGAETTSMGQDELTALPFEVDLAPEPPDADADWNPLVKRFWEALKVDPARKWMTSADWAAAAIFFESMSRDLEDQPVISKDGEVTMVKVPLKGTSIAGYLKFMADLGVTEAGRLRMRKEITLFPTEEPQLASVADLDAARDGLVQ